jgi:hypothetical protein
MSSKAYIEVIGVRRPMRPKVVRLIDVGLDDRFDASMSFVQSTLRNINAGADSAIVEVEFVRSRDLLTVGMAFTAKVDVLHVMAHGDHSEGPVFSSSDQQTSYSLDQLAGHVVRHGRGIQTGAVIADGCKTATTVWQRAFSDVLQGPITYIGTTANVGWHEGTVFGAMFYGVLYRNKRTGIGPVEAAMRAAEAYSDLLGRKCPYKAIVLEPSRWARENLQPTGT